MSKLPPNARMVALILWSAALGFTMCCMLWENTMADAE